MATAVAGAGVPLVFLTVVDLGGTVSGTKHPISFILAAVWAGPAILHATLVRGAAASLAGGPVLLVATILALESVWSTTSSTVGPLQANTVGPVRVDIPTTAGIGLFSLPVLLYSATGASIGLDQLKDSALHVGRGACRSVSRFQGVRCTPTEQRFCSTESMS